MRTIAVISLILALVAGCARIPEPTGYQYSTQPKMQAAHHWVVLASDVANRINNQLVTNDYAQTSLFVKATCGDEDSPCAPQETSAFNEAFRDLLITELVRFGVPVRQQPDEGTITVHYKVQMVYHNARRVRTIQPGLLTGLAAGIMVLRNAPVELQAIAAGGVLDYLNMAAVHHSAHEIIITTSMIARNQYLFRTSDLYYINDKDFSHYQDSGMAQATEIQLTSPAAFKKTQPGPVMPPPASPQTEAPTEEPKPITGDTDI